MDRSPIVWHLRKSGMAWYLRSRIHTLFVTWMMTLSPQSAEMVGPGMEPLRWWSASSRSCVMVDHVLEVHGMSFEALFERLVASSVWHESVYKHQGRVWYFALPTNTVMALAMSGFKVLGCAYFSGDPSIGRYFIPVCLNAVVSPACSITGWVFTGSLYVEWRWALDIQLVNIPELLVLVPRAKARCGCKRKDSCH